VSLCGCLCLFEVVCVSLWLLCLFEVVFVLWLYYSSEAEQKIHRVSISTRRGKEGVEEKMRNTWSYERGGQQGDE